MLAVFSLLGFMAMNEPAPARDADAPTRELAQVFEQARRDFEAHHAELGLVGAASLAGEEPAQRSPNATPPQHVESIGAPETPAATALPKPATRSH